MIEREYGKCYATCDACGKSHDYIYSDFQDMVDGMKAHDWKTVKIGNEWVNYCPDCAAKMTRPNAGEFAGI